MNPINGRYAVLAAQATCSVRCIAMLQALHSMRQLHTALHTLLLLVAQSLSALSYHTSQLKLKDMQNCVASAAIIYTSQRGPRTAQEGCLVSPYSEGGSTSLS